MRDRQTRVTMKDIASQLNVSVTTVSRAMADKPDISPEMKQRVLELAREKGYVKSALGRGLVTGFSGAVGCVVRTPADAVGGSILEGVEDVATEKEIAVMIASSRLDMEREIAAIDRFDSYGVAGILVLCSQSYPETKSRLGMLRSPTVFVSSDEPGFGAKTVRADNLSGSASAVSHLIELGHRRIAHLSVGMHLAVQGETSLEERLTFEGQQRYTGYRKALADHGLPFDPRWVVAIEDSREGGERGIQQVLGLEPRPTAVFCFDDEIALGAMATLARLGLHVPRDLSVVGFDDIPIAAWVSPTLTTVRQPLREIGRFAMETVLDMLAERPCADETVFPCELVLRGSTAPPLSE